VVADVGNPMEASTPTPFFAVSLLKLTIMSICTIGIYEIYWFYKNWQLVREREQSKILPVWRAIFGVIFCYACFARIKNQGKSIGLAQSLPAGALAIAWIVVTITWRLPDPYWLISYLSVAFLLPVQAYVNAMNKIAAPGHDPNARFTGWNWAAIAAGVIILALAILGSFVEPE
jgi:hypothetical protein